MAVMAQWGPKTWAVSPQKVMALQGLSFSYSQVAENNASTEEQKPTNERGTDLVPLSFTTTLHSGAGVDVWAEIKSWESLVTKVFYFYLGGKNLGPKFQLRKVSVGDTKIDDIGRLRLATISFDFKEYVEDTTKAQMSTTALNVTASTEEKEQAQIENTAVTAAETITIKKGDYVKPTGTKYATGQTIPQWVKERSHQVYQIKESENKVLLGHPDGINSWVYLNEVTLV